jgi:hypothetical protein
MFHRSLLFAAVAARAQIQCNRLYFQEPKLAKKCSVSTQVHLAPDTQVLFAL